jgi:pimeloyl-ACP methyl ester carboxylesterase
LTETDAIRTADRGDGVVVAGNSLGALLALRAARADVTGIVSVLALAPPGSVIAGPLRALPALGWLFSRIITVAPVPDTVIRHITSRVVVLVCGGPRTPASVRRRYATHLGRDRLRNLVAVGARALPAFLSEINWPADEIDLPVTLWWGTRDHVCPVRGADRYTSIGRTIITTDAKHCPHFDDPDFVLSLLDSHEGWAASWWNSSGAVQTQSTEADAYDGTTTQGIAAEANTTSRHPAPRQPSSAQFERARLAVSTWTRDHPTSYTRPSQRDT